MKLGDLTRAALTLSLIFSQARPALAEMNIDFGGVTYSVADDGSFTGSNGSSGNIDFGTGDFSMSDGQSANLADLSGAVVSDTTSGGSEISTVIDSHSYDYQASMYASGYAYAEAYENNDQAGMNAAVARANAGLSAESGGTQGAITVNQTGAYTYNYGCINNQNTTLTLAQPPAQYYPTPTPWEPGDNSGPEPGAPGNRGPAPYVPPCGAGGPPCAPVYEDSAIRIFHNGAVVTLAEEPANQLTSPVRVFRNGRVRGLVLVPVNDPMASSLHVQTASGVRAIRRFN